MERDKDAICALMERGLWGFETSDSKSDYEAARSLYDKWCVERAPCPECDGEGSYLDEWWTEDDYGVSTVTCDHCKGAGTVPITSLPKPPPPPPAWRKQYEIVNAGIVDDCYRVWARDKNSPDNRLFTADTEQEAMDQAAAWVNERLGGPPQR